MASTRFFIDLQLFQINDIYFNSTPMRQTNDFTCLPISPVYLAAAFSPELPGDLKSVRKTSFFPTMPTTFPASTTGRV